jgi:hypothetical protein
MKSLLTKMFIAAFGLALATVPLTASAAQWGIGVNVAGPGYAVHTGYVNPGSPCYGCGRPGYWRHPRPHRYWGPRPVAVSPAYYEGYYGWAPAGYYGYYSHGRWFAHRRWNGGVYLYF